MTAVGIQFSGGLMPSNDRGRTRDLGCAGVKIRVSGVLVSAGALAFGIAVAPLPANAADLPNLPGVSSPPPLIPAPTGNWVLDWLNMVSASQAAQPHWMTPLVTVTPRLEQEFRFDFFDQQNGGGTQGNDYHILNWGGGKGLEFIPTYNTEIILGFPPYEQATSPKGVETDAWGDYPIFLAKYRFISANEENGNYIVTGFFQMSQPLGNNAIGTSDKITNNVWIAQPTLAFGKGWGDFDIQATISQQYPFAALASPGNTAHQNLVNFGDPVLVNVAFQYHIFEYLWPELEVNYEYWPNGEHEGLSQVLLTPGIIFGRFKIGMDTPTRPINLIFGAGYQFSVTSNPVIANNWVATARITF
jgi:hypothetical protein